MAEDRRQDIVKVMGDAAGKRADGLHLLGLEQLHLQHLLLGNIPVERLDMRFSSNVDGLCADLENDLSSILLVMLRFIDDRFAIENVRQSVVDDPLAILYLQQPVVCPEERCTFKSVQFTEPMIHGHHNPVRVKNGDPVVCIVEERAVSLLRDRQVPCLLCNEILELRGMLLELALFLFEVVLQAQLIEHAPLAQDPPGQNDNERRKNEGIVRHEFTDLRDMVKDKDGKKIDGIDNAGAEHRDRQAERNKTQDAYDKQIHPGVIG